MFRTNCSRMGTLRIPPAYDSGPRVVPSILLWIQSPKPFVMAHMAQDLSHRGHLGSANYCHEIISSYFSRAISALSCQHCHSSFYLCMPNQDFVFLRGF